MRFSDLPDSRKHELRSNWARKAARTRAKARRIVERERARIEREATRAARERLRVERVRLREIEAAAKAQRKIERAASKALRDVERAVERKAIEARKRERAKRLIIRQIEKAKRQKILAAKRAEAAKKRAIKEAEKAKRARSRASRLGWKRRKEKAAKARREALPFEPVQPNAKNQAQLIRDSFDRAKERVHAHFPALISYYTVAKLKSGGVWGTLTIDNLPPEGATVYEFLIDLENWVYIPKNHWVWTDTLGDFESLELEPGEEDGKPRIYQKFQGRDVIPVHPHKPGIGEPYMWAATRDIVSNLMRNNQATPSGIKVNLYWDSLGAQPKGRSKLLRQPSKKK